MREAGGGVLVGHRTYERLVAGQLSFIEAYEEFARTVDLSELDFDLAKLPKDVRDPSPGRGFRL